MTEDKIESEFREGRISRRAFVRELVERGSDMPAALARAEALVPNDTPSAATASAEVLSQNKAPSHSDGLEVNFVGDGYLVYHRERRRMHSLNNTAALVFELCNGENDGGDIARLLQQAYDLPTAPEAEVRDCLASLAQERLIT